MAAGGTLGVLRRLVCASTSMMQLKSKQSEKKTNSGLVLIMRTIYHSIAPGPVTFTRRC